MDDHQHHFFQVNFCHLATKKLDFFFSFLMGIQLIFFLKWKNSTKSRNLKIKMKKNHRSSLMLNHKIELQNNIALKLQPMVAEDHHFNLGLVSSFNNL